MKKGKLKKRIADPNSPLWRNKADKLWSTIIHLSNKCAVCSAIINLQAHHLIPREVKRFRHIIENGILLCINHHKYCKAISAHKNPIAFIIWLQAHNPAKWCWLQESCQVVDTTDDCIGHGTYKQAYEELLKLKAILDSKITPPLIIPQST